MGSRRRRYIRALGADLLLNFSAGDIYGSIDSADLVQVYKCQIQVASMKFSLFDAEEVLIRLGKISRERINELKEKKFFGQPKCHVTKMFIREVKADYTLFFPEKPDNRYLGHRAMLLFKNGGKIIFMLSNTNIFKVTRSFLSKKKHQSLFQNQNEKRLLQITTAKKRQKNKMSSLLRQ